MTYTEKVLSQFTTETLAAEVRERVCGASTGYSTANDEDVSLVVVQVLCEEISQKLAPTPIRKQGVAVADAVGHSDPDFKPGEWHTVTKHWLEYEISMEDCTFLGISDDDRFRYNEVHAKRIKAMTDG